MNNPPPVTELDKIVCQFPDVAWDFDNLSCNTNISWSTVLALPEKPWHRGRLQANPRIKNDPSITAADRKLFNLISDEDERKWWNERHDLMNKNPVALLLWYAKSERFLFTQAELESWIHLGWNWKKLSSNPSITIDILVKYPDRDWDWEELSKHKNITMEMITAHSLPWVYSAVSLNPNLTLEAAILFKDKGLNWSHVSRSLDLDPFFRKARNLPQNWWTLTEFKNLKLEFEKFCKLPWSWGELTINASVLAVDILNTPVPWHECALAENPNKTLELVQKYPFLISPSNLSRLVFTDTAQITALHINRLRKIRNRIRHLVFRNWYKLYLLTKKPEFWAWYCAPGNIGNTVDKRRIEKVFI